MFLLNCGNYLRFYLKIKKKHEKTIFHLFPILSGLKILSFWQLNFNTCEILIIDLDLSEIGNNLPILIDVIVKFHLLKWKCIRDLYFWLWRSNLFKWSVQLHSLHIMWVYWSNLSHFIYQFNDFSITFRTSSYDYCNTIKDTETVIPSVIM